MDQVLHAGDAVTISVEAVPASSGSEPNLENIEGKPEPSKGHFCISL